jgi:hypothetical protein
MNNNTSAASPASGKLVVVLGMHRSGTTAIVRAMVALGAELGERVRAPAAGVADHGFFEDFDVAQINQELLAAAGVPWHTVGDIGLDRIAPAQLDALRARAADTLREKCTGRTFALKDPRLARLMPFWQPVFEQIGVPVVYVIAVRNPVSVARSLAKRDDMAEAQAYALWLAHVVPALRETQRKARAFVDYDRMMDDPAGELSRLASTLQMQVDAAQADEFARSFLDEGLRHSRFSVADLTDVRVAPSAVKTLHAALDTVCRTGDEGGALHSAVESAQQFLADIGPLLHVYQNANELSAKQARAPQAPVGSPIVAAAMAAAAAKKAAAAQAAMVPAVSFAAHRTRTIFSFIVDAGPKCAYEGYHLARSLIRHSCDQAADINVQFTQDVDEQTRDLFRRLGCTLHDIERFGDGRYCNKIGQLTNLHRFDFDHVVLLDTNTMAIGDLRPFLSEDAMVAKVVDLPQPPLPVLEEIARTAGVSTMPPVGTVDAVHAPTFAGNCDSGFYGIPKAFAEMIDRSWRRWAQWLLEHNEPLMRAGAAQHIDQVSMWLALLLDRIPYRAAPSNVNYFVHFAGEHRYLDAGAGIALIRYHDASLNELGKLAPQAQLNESERLAISVANEQFGAGFDEEAFRNLRTTAGSPKRVLGALLG